MKNFKEIVAKAKSAAYKPRIIVPCPYDKNVLKALYMIQSENIGDVILVGDKEKVDSINQEFDINIAPAKFVEAASDNEALTEAYNIMLRNEADIIMKGLVQTKDFMKVILSNKSFIKSKLLTHCSIYEISSIKRLLFVTDPSIIVEPTVEQKIIILNNAIDLLKSMEVEAPKIAIISSTELINAQIKSSVDADYLMNVQKENNCWDADIYGPLAIDNAISKEAAELKKINSTVAGNADLLLMPNLDCGNIFCKGLTYIAGFESAGIVMGAHKPIVLTSRSASPKEKFNSLAIACIIAQKNNTI